MSYTNTFYDETKVKQYMDENTYINQYRFHMPGNGGNRPAYVDDPHVRLTKWGANRWTNNVYIEDQLNNRGRRHTRRRHDYTLENLRENIEGNCSKLEYPDSEPLFFETRQSRAENPAWTLRDSDSLPQYTERHYPLFNPQTHVIRHGLRPVAEWS
ncbi:MAG: hypothetical protein EB075_14745, partial [Bacteroidetes bacterium]|nr:hypothetical protein [Bacteroidota bacterium]